MCNVQYAHSHIQTYSLDKETMRNSDWGAFVSIDMEFKNKKYVVRTVYIVVRRPAAKKGWPVRLQVSDLDFPA